jgi:hypothetical protein
LIEKVGDFEDVGVHEESKNLVELQNSTSYTLNFQDHTTYPYNSSK